MSLSHMSMDLVMDKKVPSVQDDHKVLQDLKERKESKESMDNVCHYQKSMKYWKKTMDQIYSMYPDTR